MIDYEKIEAIQTSIPWAQEDTTTSTMVTTDQ